MILCFPFISNIEYDTNILNLSKIEQQTILTGCTRFNVSEQIWQVIALLDQKWSEKGITVVFDCGEYGRKCSKYPRFRAKNISRTGINKKLPLLKLYQQR